MYYEKKSGRRENNPSEIAIPSRKCDIIQPLWAEFSFPKDWLYSLSSPTVCHLWLHWPPNQQTHTHRSRKPLISVYLSVTSWRVFNTSLIGVTVLFSHQYGSAATDPACGFLCSLGGKPQSPAYSRQHQVPQTQVSLKKACNNRLLF